MPKITKETERARGLANHAKKKQKLRDENTIKHGGPRELETSPFMEPGVIEGYEADFQNQIYSGDYYDKPMREIEAHEALFMLGLAKELRGRDVSGESTMQLVRMAEIMQKTRESRVRLGEFIAGRADSRPEVQFREGALELLSDKDFRIVEEKMVAAYKKQKLIEN